MTEWHDYDHPPDDSVEAGELPPLEEFLAAEDFGRPHAIPDDQWLEFGTLEQEQERAHFAARVQLVRNVSRDVPPEVLVHSILHL